MNSSTPNNPVSSKTRNLTAILLILFFPVGLILMWSKKVWTPVTRVIITSICVLIVIIGMGTDPNSTNLNQPIAKEVISKGPTSGNVKAKPEEPIVVDEEVELTDDIKAELNKFKEYAEFCDKKHTQLCNMVEVSGWISFQEFVDSSTKIRDEIESFRNEIQSTMGTTVKDYQGSKYTRQAFLRLSGTAHFLWQAWYDGHRFASAKYDAGSGGTEEEYKNSLSNFVQDYNDLCEKLEHLSEGGNCFEQIGSSFKRVTNHTLIN